jgi:7,8-dihydropterin-6-yl-methyl-4-(beta-D-ribofuranosyl)aminobenzene 5'-phosphate synthase
MKLALATAFRDEWKVEFIAPVHCSGEAAFAALQQACGNRDVYAGLGTAIVSGLAVTPFAEVGESRAQAMDDEDLRSYSAEGA